LPAAQGELCYSLNQLFPVIWPEKDEKKILELVKIAPGQELNYPSLEAARAQAARFRDAFGGPAVDYENVLTLIGV